MACFGLLSDLMVENCLFLSNSVSLFEPALLSLVFDPLTLGPKVPLQGRHYADQLLKMFLNIGAS
jgi:hypothetical protein